MKKRLEIEDTIEKVYRLMERKDNAELEKTFHRLCEEFNRIHVDEDPYSIYVQFEAMACIVRCCIFAGNRDAVQYELQMITAFYGVVGADVLSMPQKMKILELLNAVCRECNDFVKAQGVDIECPDVIKNFGKVEKHYSDIDHNECTRHDCYLCKLREGNFKGSHLAPNFLIQPFLSSDSTTDREKTIVTELELNAYKKSRVWGRGVGRDEVKEQFGDVPEEEIVTAKPDPLTRDFFFCHQCEDRFGFFENSYSEYFNKRKSSVSPEVSYLFWIGVFWRLSVAHMCFKMSEEDEEEARRILDEYMPYSGKELRKLKADPGFESFRYTIVHCSDTKGERMALLGNHARKSPYKLVVGQYIITLYSSPDDVVSSYPLNEFSRNEQVVEVPFLDYWRLKQEIMDETQYAEYSNMGSDEKPVSDVMRGGENDGLDKALAGICGTECNADSLKDDGEKYGFVIPGALMKLFAYMNQHPFDSPDELWKGFEREYGYTKEDMEAIANESLDDGKIKRFK